MTKHPHGQLTQLAVGSSICPQLLQDFVQEKIGHMVHGSRDSA